MGQSGFNGQTQTPSIRISEKVSENTWHVLAEEGRQYRSFHLLETTGGRAELV